MVGGKLARLLTDLLFDLVSDWWLIGSLIDWLAVGMDKLLVFG